MNKDHKNTFNTPEGYFESFNEKLFARLEAEEDEPNTDFLPKTDDFKVPGTYFEEIYPKVGSRLKKDNPKVISLNRRRIFFYAAAAVAALFVLTLGWNWNQSPDFSFEDLADTDIETYFENNELNFSSYEIAETVDLEDLSITDFSDETIQEESILEYLDENVEDLEDLDLDYEAL